MNHIRSALCVLAVVTQLGAHSASASTPLSALTIRLGDLRPGYIATDFRHRTSTTLATREAVGAPLLLVHGWADGYDALYQRSNDHAAQVGESADRFKTSAGAHWWYEVSVLRVPSGYHPVPTARVGDESTAVQSSGFVGVIFRRAEYVMDIYVSTRIPSALGSALALAQLTDRRLLQDAAHASQTLPSHSAALKQQARPAHARTAAHKSSTQHPATQPGPAVAVHTKTTVHARATTSARAGANARATAHAHAAGQARSHPAVQVWVQPNPVPYLGVATLYARTAPGAVCSDTVKYATRHPSPPFGGFRLVVGSTGVATWSWHNQVTGVHGKVTVTCTIQGQTKTSSAGFITAG